MEAILGNSLPVFFGLTVFVVGGASYLTGQAVAVTWRPVWQAIFFCVLLGFVNRFLSWGLFGGDGLSISGFLVNTAVLIAIGLAGYRLTQVSKIVNQYPWLYERAGLWSYRKRAQT
ncbi:MAG: DUF6867 family protein [Alphaproteobacteria bacterium]